MTKEQAIEAARAAKRDEPEFFHRLRPRPNRKTGTWVVECSVTPIAGFIALTAFEVASACDILHAMFSRRSPDANMSA